MTPMVVRALTHSDQIKSLEPWLKSFDHRLPENPTGVFHLFTRGERTLALTQQTQMNVIFPAVNPKVVTPKETKQIADYALAWHIITPNGLHAAVPYDSPMIQFMPRLGYRPKSIIFEPIP